MNDHNDIVPRLAFKELYSIRLWLGLDIDEVLRALPCDKFTLVGLEAGHGEDSYNAPDIRELYAQYLCRVIANCLEGIPVPHESQELDEYPVFKYAPSMKTEMRRLREERARLGMTQDAAAVNLNISRSELSKYEIGEREAPQWIVEAYRALLKGADDGSIPYRKTKAHRRHSAYNHEGE